MHAKLKSSFRWFVYSDAGELGNFGEGFYFTFYTRLGQEAHHGSLWSEPLQAVLGCLRDGPGVSVCSQLRFCGSVFYLHVATSVFLCVFSEFLFLSVSALRFPDRPRSSADLGKGSFTPSDRLFSPPSAHFRLHITSSRGAVKGAGYPRPRSWFPCSRVGESERQYFLKAAPPSAHDYRVQPVLRHGFCYLKLWPKGHTPRAEVLVGAWQEVTSPATSKRWNLDVAPHRPAAGCGR